MGFSLSKIASKLDPVAHYLRKNDITWGRIRKSLMPSMSNSAMSYDRSTSVNPYGIANDYRLNRSYRSLAELTES